MEEEQIKKDIFDLQLGALYSPQSTSFRLWSPAGDPIKLNLYKDPEGSVIQSLPMNKEGELFSLTLKGDYKGYFYNFERQGKEATDPYSRAASMNSKRSAIVDLRETDPPGFSEDHFLELPQQKAVIYEVHVGDFTFDPSSGVQNRGKFLGFTEAGTHFEGLSTGIDHLKELGISHVHLMPIFEFSTVDQNPDRFGDLDNYNWGYDPELYNVPAGIYSMKPRDPRSRIFELKKMIMDLHKAGIGVIMDVVYNHTYKSKESNFNILAPGAYYRTSNGKFTNGSGVGNELATERPMVRKFILDSLSYWQNQYHIDGFRFDLMALIDQKTVDQACEMILKKNPWAIIYGEPWTGGRSSLSLKDQTLWPRQRGKKYSLFNENYRKTLAGDENGNSRGFVQGNAALADSMAYGITGSIPFMENKGELQNPQESINYFNAHDNLIFEDLLRSSVGKGELYEPMTKLAFGLLLTSQGIVFFHAGNEFRRTKKMDANSYNSSYKVNAIDWSYKKKNKELVFYVEDLIALRKAYPVLSLESGEEVRKRVKKCQNLSDNILAYLYQIEEDNDDDWLLVIHYNGWDPFELSEDFIFHELRCSQIDIQRIFDHRGKDTVNRVSNNLADRESIKLNPLSTTIFSLKRRGVQYEL